MSLFTAPSAPSRTRVVRPKDDIDEFLSSDLELSFASTMSLNSPEPSRAPSPNAMDISPAVPLNKAGNLLVPPARHFGREVQNNIGRTPSPVRGPPEPKSSSRGRQRAALPFEWISAGAASEKDNSTDSPALPVSPADAMEVDSMSPPSALPVAQLNAPSSPCPVALPASGNYANLFFGDSSPEVPQVAAKKRRSQSPETVACAERKFERAATTGSGLLFKKPAFEYAAPSGSTRAPRRPALSTIVPPTVHAQSAYPIADSPPTDSEKSHVPPPVRRAFSAMVPPSSFNFSDAATSDDASDGQTSSPAAAYAKRQGARVIRRCDGTDDFRPLNSAGSLGKRDRDDFQVAAKGSPRGLAGFGVKEVENKILPCYPVSEDGLVRITASTLQSLLEGKFSSRVGKHIVVDCRFEYEYNGGHIPGAINLNTNKAIEDHFFVTDLPTPRQSGDPEARTVLIFHCEFSVKRAPTFAKHLRSLDRAANGRVYPKVCYPEMYILDGGYCGFFNEFPKTCEPQGYIAMDDPEFRSSRQTDLDKFRRREKWSRTQSYTYGQKQTSSKVTGTTSATTSASTIALREKRNTAPSGMFGRPKRNGSGVSPLCTLDEDVSGHEADSSSGTHELQDSPCPPPQAKAKRASMGRATSFR